MHTDDLDPEAREVLLQLERDRLRSEREARRKPARRKREARRSREQAKPEAPGPLKAIVFTLGAAAALWALASGSEALGTTSAVVLLALWSVSQQLRSLHEAVQELDARVQRLMGEDD